MRSEAALPDDENGPQHEQPGEHQARHHAGKEEPADRRLGRDAVQDEGDRRRDQNAERAARADRTGGNIVRIAALAHLRNAHLADRGAAGGRRAGERSKDGAGSEIGDHQSARNAVEPAVERLIEVLAGGRGADGGTHHHEHGNRHQREVMQAGIKGFRRHAQRVHALEDHQKRKGDGAEPESDWRAREQDDQSYDEDDDALGGGAHTISPTASLAAARAASSAVAFGGRPNGGSRPVTSFMSSATYCRLRIANPNGIAAYGIHMRARHTDSERQLFSQASCQNWNVSTVMTTQKASAISAEAIARR